MKLDNGFLFLVEFVKNQWLNEAVSISSWEFDPPKFKDYVIQQNP